MTSVSPNSRRFELIAVLGRGAWGEVYLAEQVSSGGFRRKVAVKMLHSEHDGFEFAQQRMRDEARILGRLSHRNIVSALDLLQMQDRWALIMDYVPGADLEVVLQHLVPRGERVPARAVMDIAAAVCSALSAAWSATDGQGGQLKLVHRDIKPANIRVTPQGEVKVLDFGVASAQLETRESRTGVRMGTENYMAPERFISHDNGPEGDVYAIGVTLVELLTGWEPGRTPVLEERHLEWLQAVRAKLGEHQVGDELIEVLASMLAHDPTARPGARDLIDVFESAARQLPEPGIEAYARETLAALDGLFAEGEPTDGTLEWEPIPTEGTWIDGAPGAPPVGARSSGASVAFETVAGLPRWAFGAAAAAVLASVGVAGALGLVLAGALAKPEATVTVGPESLPAMALEGEAPTWEPLVLFAAAEPLDEADQEEISEPKLVAAVAAPRPIVGKAAPAELTGPVTRVSRALFAVDDVASMSVTCGDVDGHGSNSVRIKQFPAGSCEVVAMLDGRTYETTVSVERPTTVSCSVRDGALVCP